jgi:cytochrome c oxidase subunit IV
MAQTVEEVGHEEEHASNKTYVVLAIILTVITAVEVASYYAEEALGAFLVPLLIVLTSAKFFLVVGYYMHLKYDHRLFRRLFLGPAVLMALLLLVVVLLFVYHPVSQYI